MKPSSLVASFNRLSLWRRRVRVWDFTLTPPTFDRWLYLWMHRLGHMAREEKIFLGQFIRPGMHVADVGANLGLYSLLLARLTGPEGRVFSFEPDALMVEALRKNLTANHVEHVEVFACAVGAAASSAVLQRNAVNSGNNRLGDVQVLLASEQATVPVCALQDALRGRRVDFIKMDVQGWEGEALRGIGGLLDANPGLQIYFEFWPHGLEGAGTSIPRLAEILRELGLRVSLAKLGKLRSRWTSRKWPKK
ncbi:MAG TPA: FkbM family methyltransferase [Opitutaceae bacterium]|nr:FkbM family methyltransferase [Opitutaceae bacterium]